MKWAMVVLYGLVSAINFLVATLYFSENSNVVGTLWSVSAGIWLGGAIIWAAMEE